VRKLAARQDIAELVFEYGFDILTSPDMRTEKTFIQHRKINCYDHSVSVACMSVWFVRRLNIDADVRNLIRGALLHDYFLYDWHEPDKSHRLHGFIHAKRALNNAKRDFDLSSMEEDIIAKHMFPLNPDVPRYKESLIVNFADKICAACELFSICAFTQTARRVEEGLFCESN
jgi:uncharacterized protein